MKAVVSLLLVLLATTTVVSAQWWVPHIKCGQSGSNTTFVNGDDMTYFATIVGTNGTGFTVTMNVTEFDTEPDCDPAVYVQFAGDGQGDHPYHQFQVYSGSNLVMKLPIKSNDSDWMFQSEIVCDYAITFNWEVLCHQ